MGNNPQFKRFCEVIVHRPNLPADPRFATNLERSRNRAELLPIPEAELSKHSRTDLLAALSAVGIPAGEVLGLLEALTSASTGGAGMVVRTRDAEGAERHVFAPPYRLDGRRAPVRRGPLALGEDTAAILAGLHRDPQEVRRLAGAGVVC